MTRDNQAGGPGNAPRKAATKPSLSSLSRALLTAGIPLDADTEMDRQKRMEAVKAELVRMLERGEGLGAIDRMMSLVVDLEREVERMALRVIQANRFRFGRSTQKLSDEEIAQLILAFGGAPPAAGEVPIVPTPAEPEQVDDPSLPEAPEPAPTPPNAPPRKKRVRVKAMKIADDVERIITTSRLTESEAHCVLCGRPKEVFTHVEHERIRFIPARIVVDVERRETAGCAVCRQDVCVAQRQHVPDVERRVDASLLAKLVGDKTVMSLPLDRQRRELMRMGLNVPDKTLQSYWAYTMDLLQPVADATLSLVFDRPIVGADDSHLKTIISRKGGGVFRAHLWCFVGTDGTVNGPEIVGYGYTPTWEATEITDWFAAIDGMIQCDGYGGYAREVDVGDGGSKIAVPPDRRLGCGMHIRAKFHDAFVAKDRRAALPLKLFVDLYALESGFKSRGLDAEARGQERREHSLPLLKKLDDWVDEIHPKLLPKSPLRRATTYAINQRAFFRRCFEDGRFEIDNGRVERRIKLFAVGRRNFFFTGSERGGHRLAAAFTLVDNCLLLGIDPHRYLVDVIKKLEAGWLASRLSELIPQNWAAAQKSAQD